MNSYLVYQFGKSKNVSRTSRDGGFAFTRHSKNPLYHLAVRAVVVTEHRTCCACGEPIADRFLLEVGGGAWHTGCLRCCVCAVQLDRHPSCFLRDRQVYCKQDYAK
ncbi:arrowhead PA [Danaus plexippus plexippus]|uniref:Arrowhead PA n=1 Tax=Danaus plexippus plexippus TaxID=278856 RepID=A0A212EKD0_DANPL|nr:arrowhead PA [Danaus plexippus plexippus]